MNDELPLFLTLERSVYARIAPIAVTTTKNGTTTNVPIVMSTSEKVGSALGAILI